MEQEKQTKWPRSEQGDVLCYDAEGKIKGALPFPPPERYFDVKGQEYKRCSHCGKYKPINLFPKVWGGRKGQYLGAYCSTCRQLAYEGKIKLRGVKSGKTVGALPQLNEKVDENGSSTLNFERPKTKVINAMEKENQSKGATTQSQQKEKSQILTYKELEELKRISEAKSGMFIASGLEANNIIIKGDAVERQKQEVLKLFNDDELIAELKKRGYKGTLKVEREITL
jgi:hypothetical protein